MHLYSKLIEVNKEVCNITVPDEYQDDAPIKHYDVDFEDQSFVLYRMKAIHAAGLHIEDVKIKTFNKLVIRFLTKGQHVRFLFYLKGNTIVENGAGNQNYRHDVGMLQRNFLDDRGGDGIVHMKEHDESIHIILKMSRDFYINLLRGETWIKDDAFHNYILTGKPENRPNETLFMDQKIFNILQEIRNCQSIENNQYHFLKLKLRELLFSIHQLKNFVSKSKNHLIASIDTLEKIRGYVLANLDNPPNIMELSKKFMLNEKKLRNDFKLAYGSTIYAFVIEERMQKAKKLLLEDYNVNELAVMLGYQSVSHFIKVFKSYHGQTPKEALKQFKTIVSSQLNNVTRMTLSLLVALLSETTSLPYLNFFSDTSTQFFV